LEIEKLYARYESELKELAKQFKISSSLSQNQTKKWFLTHLVGNRVTEVEKGFDAQFIIELNKLVDSLISENYAAIKSCRENITKSIHQSAFTQNKAYMEGIITNLLELLAHLKRTRVAMRDLKPDNLLVAGNKEKYPSFLAYPKEYKIGLIDVETAAIYSSSGNRTMRQPPLGGTPQYATVSHLFTNLQLNNFYKNLGMILHLQDWYAVVAMIYRTVTGLPLFEKTARILPTMISAIRELGAEKPEQFHNVNQVFWSSGVAEFKENMKERGQRLRALNISMLDQARKMFKEFASSEKREITEEIEQHVNSSNIQLSANDQEFLRSCSYEKTSQLRKKWENRSETQATQKLENFHIIALLQKLEGLKLDLEKQEQMLKLLDDSEPQIPANSLLEFMFEIVLRHMYGQDWRSLMSGVSTDVTPESSYATSEVTIEVKRDQQTETIQI
jgi:serine/threonine protein kinase